jgi:putative endonuclease
MPGERRDDRRGVGIAGEDAVAAWYQARGYEIVARNWRTRRGELDIVAFGHGAMVFCEVKTRRGDAFGLPVEAVTPRKQQRLRELARAWLTTAPTRPGRVRFDIASVTPDGRGGWLVEVLEAAF